MGCSSVPGDPEVILSFLLGFAADIFEMNGMERWFLVMKVTSLDRTDLARCCSIAGDPDVIMSFLLGFAADIFESDGGQWFLVMKVKCL